MYLINTCNIKAKTSHKFLKYFPKIGPYLSAEKKSDNSFIIINKDLSYSICDIYKYLYLLILIWQRIYLRCRSHIDQRFNLIIHPITIPERVARVGSLHIAKSQILPVNFHVVGPIPNFN